MIICVINILFCGLVYADEQKFDGNNILDNTSVLKDYLDEESKHDLPDEDPPIKNVYLLPAV